jgi:uncharacterized GH25 family protein
LRRLPPIAAALALSLLPGAAHAHEFWLAPSAYAAAPGATLSVFAFVGTGFRGEALPYSARRAVRFLLQAAAPQDLAPLGRNGELAYAELPLRDDRGLLVAYESSFGSIHLEPAAFDAYLELEGLDGPREERAKLGPARPPGRERYARCAKTWVAGTDPARAEKVAGLTLEIVPLADPTTTGELTLRVLYRREPLAGALVRAWRQPLAAGATPANAASRDSVGAQCDGRTDAQGIVRLPLEGTGEWLVSTVHMVPCPEPEAADWQSYWASYTFARRGGRAGEDAGEGGKR